MGVKISAATPAASVAGTELLPVSQSGTPRSMTVNQVKDYTIDQIEAIAAGTTAPLTDKAYILQGGALKPVLLSVIAQNVIDSVWGKADQATPADANKLPLKDGSTEKTVTLSGLAAYVQATIRAAVLNPATLDAAGATAGADLFVLGQAGVAKKITLTAVNDAIYAGLSAHVTAQTASSGAADADVFYTVTGAGVRKTTLAQIKTAIGGGVTPPATTTPTRVPQWGASQFALVDGLDVRETIRAQTDALHTALATEKAIRDMIQGMTSVLGRATTATEATQSVTLRGDCQIAVVDSNGDAIAERALLRVWVSDTDFGAPSDTDNTVAVATGTTIQTVTANAHYLILTDATGAAEIRVTLTGAASRYVMVAQGNRVTSAHLSIAVIA